MPTPLRGVLEGVFQVCPETLTSLIINKRQRIEGRRRHLTTPQACVLRQGCEVRHRSAFLWYNRCFVSCLRASGLRRIRTCTYRYLALSTHIESEDADTPTGFRRRSWLFSKDSCAVDVYGRRTKFSAPEVCCESCICSESYVVLAKAGKFGC